MTAIGSDQRSYCADRIRNTMTMPRPMAMAPVPPAWIS